MRRSKSLQSVIPAYHWNCLNSRDPPQIKENCHGFQHEKNASDRRHDESPEDCRSDENVKKLASSFEQLINQHKLRQAILKGSRTPRGACQDLETSYDSIKNTCNEAFGKSKYQDCRETRYAHNVSVVKSDTPKIKQSLKLEKGQDQVSNSNFADIFYTFKESRDAFTDCENKDMEEKKSQSMSGPCQAEDNVRYHMKAIGRDIRIKSGKDTVAALSLYRVGSKASTHSNDEHIKDDQSNGKVVMGVIITNDNQDGLGQVDSIQQDASLSWKLLLMKREIVLSPSMYMSLTITFSNQYASVDSDKIGQWMDRELETIQERMKQKSFNLVHGTESDRCHHESKDIFPKSVLKEDMEKASKKIPAHILDSEVDDNLKPDRHFRKKGGDDEMIKSEFARSSSEAVGFNDLEFQEFYIDDHLSNGENIQEAIVHSEASFLHFNTSTKYATDNSDIATVIADNVVKKTQFILHTVGNVKSPDFLKENLSLSFSNGDNAEKQLDKLTFQEFVSDVETSSRENKIPCSSTCEQEASKGLTPLKEHKAILCNLKDNTFHVHPFFGCAFCDCASESDHQAEDLRYKYVDDGDDDNTLCLHAGDCKKDALMIEKGTSFQTTAYICTKMDHLTSETKTCRFRNIQNSCIGESKMDDARSATGRCQTSSTEQDLRTVVDNDSDNDQWVNNKLRFIQNKIECRRPKIAHSTISNENIDNEECRSICTAKRGSSKKTFGKNFDTVTNYQLLCSSRLSSENVNKSFQNGDEIMHRSLCSTAKGSSLDEGYQTIAELPHLRNERNAVTMPKHDLGRSDIDRSHSQTYCTERSGEILPRRCQLMNEWCMDSDNTHSTVDQMKRQPSELSYTDNTSYHKTTNNSKMYVRYIQQKSWKKSQDDISSYSWKACLKECSAPEIHCSVLQKLDNIIPNVTDKGVCSIYPLSMPLSESKFSLGHTSKSLDRIINFQSITDSDGEKSDFEPAPVPSQRASIMKESSFCKDAIFYSHDHNHKIVETWLEQENFAERENLASSRQPDHQSITSKIMKLQSMYLKHLDTHREYPIPLKEYPAQNSSSLPHKTDSKLSFSYSHETDHKSHFAQSSLKDSPRLICPKDHSIRSKQVSKKKSSEFSYIQGDKCSRSTSPHNISVLTSQKTSMDQRKLKQGTLAPKQNDNCCLTLDLRISTGENGTGAASFWDGSETESHTALHHFYIPNERCGGGCTSTMNIQISPTHPETHRISTTVTDHASGLTETILHQTIITHNLKSTIRFN